MPTHHKTVTLQLFKHLREIWKLNRLWVHKATCNACPVSRHGAKGVLYYQEQDNATFGNSRAFPAYCAYAYVYDQGTMAIRFWNQEQRRPTGLLHALHFY